MAVATSHRDVGRWSEVSGVEGCGQSFTLQAQDLVFPVLILTILAFASVFMGTLCLRCICLVKPTFPACTKRM